MKKLYILFLLVFNYTLNSQSLSLFSIDTSKFTTLRAKFYAFDEQGKQILNLSPGDFELIENGIERKVTYISCPTPKPLQKVSVAMSIDVSGSMSSRSGHGFVPVELGKSTARELCKKVQMPPSEFALQICDSKANILQDFTTEKNSILSKIESINATGGNDFVEQLLNPKTGILNIAKTGRNKRVAVIYTDAWWSKLKDEELKASIDTCLKYSITFYTVIYSKLESQPNGIKESLKQLSESTGGQFFDGITSNDAADRIAALIQAAAQDNNPCTIEWISGDDCNEFRNVLLMYKLNNSVASDSYYAPVSEMPKIEYSPSASMKFGVVNQQLSETKEITLTARNKGFIINSITLTNPEEFEIVDWGGYPPPPFTIIKDRSRTLKIKFKPKKSGYSFSFCGFEVETSACSGLTFFATGGILNSDVQNGELKLTYPNGGETFVAGSDTIITWTGILPEDTVSLEYSLNSGKNWKNITNIASNFKYNWQGLPKTASTDCLMKVRKMASVSYKKGELINILGLGAVNQVSYSPNSNRIIVAHKNLLVLVDLQLRKIIHTFEGHKFQVLSVSFSPEGERIASGSSDGVIKIWDVNTGKELRSFDSISTYTNVVSYSPDGGTIAAGCSDYTIKLLDADNGKIKGVLTGHQASVFSLAFHPDGSQIVSGGFDRTIKLWDVASGSESMTFTGHSGTVNTIAFSRDGSRIASGSQDMTVKLWHAKTGKLIYALPIDKSMIESICFSPDGKKLYGGTRDGKVKLWNTQYGTELKSFSSGVNILKSITISADGMNIALGSNGAITVLDANYGTELASFSGHSKSVNSVIINPSDSLIASTGDDGKIILWDLKTGWGFKSISGKSNWMQTALFSKDGKTVFSCSNGDSIIRVWDVETGDEIRTFRGHTGGVSKIALTDNGDKLVSSGLDFTLKVWDVKTGTVIKDIPVLQSYVCSVDMSPDGNSILLGKNDNSIKILDVNTGDELLNLTGHKQRVNEAIYNPSGTRIASGSVDKTVKIWDANSGKELMKFSEHKNPVKSLAFNNTGDKLVSGDEGGNIIVWDLIEETSSMSFTGNFGSINSIVFNKTGDKIVGGGSDNTVCIWAIKDISENNYEEDVSDSLWAIIAPQISSFDIDMGIVATGSQKDSLVNDFVRNTGTLSVRIDSIYITGKDSSAFSLLSGFPKYVLDSDGSHNAELRFSPNELRNYQADIIIITQSDTLIQKISGQGVESQIKIVTDLVDFGKVYLNYFKDTTVTTVIENISQNIVNITDVENAGPDKKQFSIISGGGAFTLNPGESREMELRFTAKELGRTSGSLAFHHANTGSPAKVQLFGEAYKVIPMLTSNSPICIEHDLYLYSDSVPGGKYHWSGPNGYVTDEQNIIIENAGTEHSGIYSLYVTLGEISSDTTYINVEINIDRVSPGDSSLIFAGTTYLRQAQDDTDKIENYILLTESRPWIAGSVWLKNRFSVKQDFSTTFEFEIKYGDNRQEPEKSAPGADGFAFVMQNHNYPSLGNKGESMGFNGITNSLAIEFDLFQNIYDPNGNHIAVQSMGAFPNTPDHRISNSVLGMNKDIMEIMQDLRYFVKIEYKHSIGELNIYMDTTELFEDAVLTIDNIDLTEYLNLENDEYVYIGFSGATGQACQEHRIYNWQIPCANQYVGVDDGERQMSEGREGNILYYYPNPAFDLLNIEYSIANSGNVSIEVFDVLGNQIKVVDYGFVESGFHHVVLSLSKDEQTGLSYFPSGMYYLVLRINEKPVYGKFGVMK